MSLIMAENVSRVLGGEDGGVASTVLENVSLEIGQGEFVSIIGPSGSGKSTLMYLLGLLDRPTSGLVRFNGKAIHELSDREIARTRNRELGFIFQFHFLLPEFTAAENVMIPLLARSGAGRGKARKRAITLLSMMDMAEHVDKKPNQLSGGQQQRVAIARALANNPMAMMGDEPTGNLDTRNSCAVFDIFEQLNREQNQTIVAVTHDRELALRARRIIFLRDGVVELDHQTTEEERKTGKCDLL